MFFKAKAKKNKGFWCSEQKIPENLKKFQRQFKKNFFEILICFCTIFFFQNAGFFWCLGNFFLNDRKNISGLEKNVKICRKVYFLMLKPWKLWELPQSDRKTPPKNLRKSKIFLFVFLIFFREKPFSTTMFQKPWFSLGIMFWKIVENFSLEKGLDQKAWNQIQNAVIKMLAVK